MRYYCFALRVVFLSIDPQIFKATKTIRFVYFFRCANTLNYDLSTRYAHYMIMLGNFGLMLVDHIHFQYNGIMFGILLISISYMLEEKFLKSAFFFAILLNMKHIFLYISPMYIVYLLKIYCLRSSSPFQVAVKLTKLAIITIGVTVLSFGPFYDQIPQVTKAILNYQFCSTQ